MILMKKNWTWHPAWQSDTEWHMTALAKETQESEDEEDDDAPDEPPPPPVNMSRLTTDQRRLSPSYLERLNCVGVCKF